MAIQFDIKNRFTGAIQLTATIECDEGAAVGVKIGLAVHWAIKSGADLSRANLSRADLLGANLSGADLSRANLLGANLSRANLSGADLLGADLSGANLSGADLSGANLSGADLLGADLLGANLSSADLVDGGQRGDGHRFVGWVKDGALMIRAGCRDLTMQEARKHWRETHGGTPLGDETMAILDHIEAVARIRRLIADRNEEVV